MVRSADHRLAQRIKKLIEAAYGAAMEDRAKPWPLILGDWCQRYGKTPAAGGIFDQDIRLLSEISAAENVYQAFRMYRYRQIGLADWSMRYPEASQIVMAIEEMLENGEIET